MATSREPPRVEWSLPAPSTKTPPTFHFAAHSTFHGNLALPPNGETLPENPHPFVYSTLCSLQWTTTVLPSKSLASVVDIFPHVGHSTESGSHSPSFCEPETSLYIARIFSALPSASVITVSILPERYRSLAHEYSGRNPACAMALLKSSAKYSAKLMAFGSGDGTFLSGSPRYCSNCSRGRYRGMSSIGSKSFISKRNTFWTFCSVSISATAPCIATPRIEPICTRPETVFSSRIIIAPFRPL